MLDFFQLAKGSSIYSFDSCSTVCTHIVNVFFWYLRDYGTWIIYVLREFQTPKYPATSHGPFAIQETSLECNFILFSHWYTDLLCNCADLNDQDYAKDCQSEHCRMEMMIFSMLGWVTMMLLQRLMFYVVIFQPSAMSQMRHSSNPCLHASIL